MTTTEEVTTDEVLEGELLPALVEPEPLSETKAKALDKKIRTQGEKVDSSADAFAFLLEQAAIGQIHVPLGMKSWTEYVKDVAQENKFLQMLVHNKVERKALVVKMTAAGMSQRTIADAFGVSKKTVQNDQNGRVDTNYPPEVTGTDGKTQPRKKKPNPELTEVEEAARRLGLGGLTEAAAAAVAEPANGAAPAEPFDEKVLPPLSVEYAEEVDLLVQSIDSFAGMVEEFITDERYPKWRKRIANKQRDRIFACLCTLRDIVNHLNDGGDA
jgi:hypothetical protein